MAPKLVAVISINGQIYTSTDSGVSWTVQTNAPSAYWYSVASSSDGAKLVAAWSGGRIYTSTNSGVTLDSPNQCSLIKLEFRSLVI